VRPKPATAPQRFISLEGVRTHNLKGFDVHLPLDGWTIVTGVSGSGKSSLAFDTLFAEGQRRYVETFSTHSRQFLPSHEKPTVDRVDHLPPAIAVSQQPIPGRVHVASASGVMDYLRALYARSCEIVCPDCEVEVPSGQPDLVFDSLLLSTAAGEMVTLQFPPSWGEGVAWEEQFKQWREAGFVRVAVEGSIVRTDAPAPAEPADRSAVRIVLDRIKIDASQRGRFVEGVETAYRFGDGRAELLLEQSVRPLFEHPTCPSCRAEFPVADATTFLSTNAESACATCQGMGEIPTYDRAKVIPDEGRSLAKGLLPVLDLPSLAGRREPFLQAARQAGMKLGVSFASLSLAERERLWNGVPEDGFEGVVGLFASIERERYKPHVRQILNRFRVYVPCPTCGGTRFQKQVLAYRVAGFSLPGFIRRTVAEARRSMEMLSEDPTQKERWWRDVLADVQSRLAYLDDVGLGYLSLDRLARTLSTGEARRVALATALGSRLAKTLFVLDEPTAGLHPSDLEPLLRSMQSLRFGGNTLVMVEHDLGLMSRADWLIDLGPGAGSQGGELLYAGPPAGLAEGAPQSLTALYGKSTPRLDRPRRTPTGKIALRGARQHHLQEVDVDFPLGVLSVVAGVSGAGKSSLVIDTLYAALGDRAAGDLPRPGAYRSIEMDDRIGEVLLVDESSLGRTSRGNPASYLGFWEMIRDLFAETAEARIRGLTKSAFSFNRPGGRCEACEGLGLVKFDMQFLPVARVVCSACAGRRFESRVLDVKYRGRSIDEVLALSAVEAFGFFRGEIQVQQRLKVLKDVGLGYLPIGQTLDTLSGGERQRLVLASYVSARPSKRCLFIMDEPTSGLHPADIDPLLDTISSLLDVGHSVLVMEHNLQMLAAADVLIELGPGAGPNGGRLIAQGTPEEVAKQKTPTGQVLAQLRVTERS
jgi:excinuclease ABC subunit A